MVTYGIKHKEQMIESNSDSEASIQENECEMKNI